MSPQPSVDIAIRACEESDIAMITAIYAHHVFHGLASFEIEPPSENDTRQRRLDIVDHGFPYLVAEHAGGVMGYAYASPYRLRPAYRYTAEDSVYLPRHGSAEASGDGCCRRCSRNAKQESFGKSSP